MALRLDERSYGITSDDGTSEDVAMLRQYQALTCRHHDLQVVDVTKLRVTTSRHGASRHGGVPTAQR